jgi:hypothetical protein
LQAIRFLVGEMVMFLGWDRGVVVVRFGAVSM